jgi:AraC-like DNA-binding protein
MNQRSSHPTGFAAPLARVVLDYVVAQGIDALPVQQALGLSLAQLADIGQRVPSSQLAQALHVASRLCGDEHAPIRIAQMIRPAHMGPLGYALISSPNISDALALFERMQRMLCNEMHSDIHLNGDVIEIHGHFLSPMPRDTQLWSFVASARLSFSRWVLGRPLVPLRMELPCPAPANPTMLLEHLGCPVQFDVEHPRELFPLGWLDLINPNSDPALHKMMSQMTHQVWGTNQEAPDEINTLLRQQISSSLKKGLAPSLEALLPELGRAGLTSVRQLQRRLAEQGLSFKEMVESVRKDQVLSDLQHTDLPLSQVALRAAYAEPASFHRAVKRWTGTTPMAYRAQHKGI